MSLRSDDTLEGKLQLLIEAVIDYGIFILDPRGFVVSWNTGAQKLKGVEGEYDLFAVEDLSVRHQPTSYLFSVPPAGLEPATCGLKVRSSTN